MSRVNLTLPSDSEINGYDLSRLQAQREQHKKQIREFQQFLEDERMRLLVVENIIAKKNMLG